MIGAVLCGPIFAVQAQRWVDILRENKNRRLYNYKRLMATRGATLSPGHVEALNTIDLEFNGKGKKDENIRRLWKEYLDHLGSLSQDPEQKKNQVEAWHERNGTFLTELLYHMGLVVGYDFDKVHIRRGIYLPIGHANFDIETQALRQGLIEVLEGRRTLPMDVRSLPGIPPPSSPPSPPVSAPSLPAG
jgi:hypothetical protein